MIWQNQIIQKTQWGYIDILVKISYRDINDMFPITTATLKTAVD